MEPFKTRLTAATRAAIDRPDQRINGQPPADLSSGRSATKPFDTDVFSLDYLRSLRHEDSARLVVAFRLNGPDQFPMHVLVRMNRLARLRLKKDPNDGDSLELKLLTDPYVPTQ